MAVLSALGLLALAVSADVPISVANATAMVANGAPTSIGFQITRSGNSGIAATIGYITVDGTAINGDDYTGTIGSITMAADVTTANVPPIAVAGEPGVQPAKQFSLELLGVGGNGPMPTLSPPTVLNGLGGSNILTADFDADGKPDLALQSSGSVAVVLNRTAAGAATPSFTQPAISSFGTGPAVAADFNGDGLLDLAAQNGSNVSILMNTTTQGASTASFAPPVSVAGEATDAADFNGDGRVDLVGPSSDGVAFLLNTTASGASTPTFETVDYPISSLGGVLYVAAGDFNQDGKPDLALLSIDGAGINAYCLAYVLLNTTSAGATSPSFSAPVQISNFSPSQCVNGTQPALHIMNFNGDGAPDIVALIVGSAQISLNTTPAGSTTASFAPFQVINTGLQQALGVVDLNGDGKPEVLAVTAVPSYQNNYSFDILINVTPPDASASSFGALPVSLTAAGNAIGLVSADFNADGRPDLALIGTTPNLAQILLNTTEGGPAEQPGGPLVSATGTIQYDSSIPSAFSFAPVTNASLETLYISNSIVVSGTNLPSSISISGGQYSINSGAYTSASGTVQPGSSVTVQLLSSASYFTGTQATLSIGGVSGTFSVTTESASGSSSGSGSSSSSGGSSGSSSGGSSTSGGGSSSSSSGGGGSSSSGSGGSSPASSGGGGEMNPSLLAVLGLLCMLRYRMRSRGSPWKCSLMNSSRRGRRGLITWRGSRGALVVLAFPAAAAVSADTPITVDNATTIVLDGAATSLNFTLTASSGGPLTVGYTTVDGTATATVDYAPIIGTVTIPAGATTANVSVPVTGEQGTMANKQLTLQLMGVGGTGSLPSFGSPGDFTLGGDANGYYSGRIAVADFNGDGKADVAVTQYRSLSPGSQWLAVLLNTTAAALSFAPPVQFSLPFPAIQIATADFNGDGKPDLAAVTYDSGNSGQPYAVAVLLNTTAAGAATPSFATPVSFAYPGGEIAVGDFNGDGLPDLVGIAASGLTFLFNTTAAGAASPSFQSASYPLPGAGQPILIASADFNGDGESDVALLLSATTTLSIAVLLNTAAPHAIVPSFAAPAYLPLGTSSVGGLQLLTGDINGDGKPDLTLGVGWVGPNQTGSGSVPAVLINTTAAGAASASFAAESEIPASAFTVPVAIGDFNGDGKPDLLTNVGGTAASLAVLANIEAPGAVLPSFSASDLVTAYLGLYPAVGELNGDGLPDLLVSDGSTLYAFLNTTPPGPAMQSGAANVSATGTIVYQSNIPYAFSFTPVNGAKPGALYTSNGITVTGTNVPSYISIYDGQYSINGGAYTSAAGTVQPGSTVTVQLAASANDSTTTEATLNVGGVGAIFSVTTRSEAAPGGTSGSRLDGSGSGNSGGGMDPWALVLLALAAIRRRQRGA